MTTQHTEGTWALARDDGGIWEGDILCLETGDVIAEGMTEGDAAFIIQAVHNYAPLMEAAKAVLIAQCECVFRVEDDVHEEDCDVALTKELLRAAIAQAEPKVTP